MQGKYVSLVAIQSSLVNFPSQHFAPQANGITPEPVFKHQSTGNLERKRHALVVDDVADEGPGARAAGRPLAQEPIVNANATTALA